MTDSASDWSGSFPDGAPIPPDYPRTEFAWFLRSHYENNGASRAFLALIGADRNYEPRDAEIPTIVAYSPRDAAIAIEDYRGFHCPPRPRSLAILRCAAAIAPAHPALCTWLQIVLCRLMMSGNPDLAAPAVTLLAQMESP